MELLRLCQRPPTPTRRPCLVPAVRVASVVPCFFKLIPVPSSPSSSLSIVCLLSVLCASVVLVYVVCCLLSDQIINNCQTTAALGRPVGGCKCIAAVECRERRLSPPRPDPSTKSQSSPSRCAAGWLETMAEESNTWHDTAVDVDNSSHV